MTGSAGTASTPEEVFSNSSPPGLQVCQAVHDAEVTAWLREAFDAAA